MTDRPILFSAPMIRATLREIEAPGTGKTQTRRVLKPQPSGDVHSYGWSAGSGATWSDEGASGRIPYWVGDRLYVREHWRAAYGEDENVPRDIQEGSVVEYLATDAGELNGRDRRAMHMPRWASRLTLYVTDVRVERLNGISNQDAIAEGVLQHIKPNGGLLTNCATGETIGLSVTMFSGAEDMEIHGSPRHAYRDLWSRINGPGAWDANPWVVAYTFVPRLGNIDAMPHGPR